MTPPRTHRHGRHTGITTDASMQAAAPFVAQLELLYALASDWSPGYGTAGDGTGRSSTPDGSPPPPGTWQPRPIDDLERITATLRVACDELVRLGVDLLHRSTDTGRRTTTGVCQACQRTVACTHADPLRAGLCTTCDTWVRRQRQRREELGLPELDRVELIHRRRIEVADADVLASTVALD
jgi:hypothetical protein